MKEIKNIKNLRFLFSIGLLLFFLAPYFIFLSLTSINADFDLNFSEFIWAFKNSIIQSSVSAFLCVLMGTYFSLGVLQLSPRWRDWMLKLVLLPLVLPSLFSILIAFSVVSPFPVGPVGVIFIFVLINLGFSVFQITHAILEKAAGFALTSEVYGISKLRYYIKVLIPLIWSDVKLNFLFVFLFCFSSLAIPLVAGGGRGTNLEVLIYEKIFIDQNWETAWVLMLVQTIIVFSLSYFYLRSKDSFNAEFKNHKFLKSKVALAGLVVYLSIYIGGYFFHLLKSLSAMNFVIEYAKDIQSATWNSLGLLVFILFFQMLVLLIWLIDYILNLRHNVAIHLVSISTILVGFSFYLFFPQSDFSDYFKVPVAFTIIFFPSLFKMFFEKRLDQLKEQIIVSKIYGLSISTILFEVLFRQMTRPVISFFSLLTIWSLSDFAISKSLGVRNDNLGLLTETFLTSYRLEAAYLVSFYILIIWLVISAFIFFLLEGLNVDHKKR